MVQPLLLKLGLLLTEDVTVSDPLAVPLTVPDSLLLPLVVAEAHTLAVPVVLRLAEGL